MLTLGSLFTGIGGLDLGLERAGIRPAFQVEIDDYCTQVLARHWPDVPRFRDVRSVGVRNLPACDILAGGFPCQDISFAGKGAGLAGARSGLWWEFDRLIGELRPRYVLVENVAALRSRGLDTVLGALAARGYDAEWDCLPASAFGAPHRRDRLFIVAYAQCERGYLRGQVLPAQLPAQHGAWESVETGRAINLHGRAVRSVPAHLRVGDGLPGGLERIKGLGNAVVPQVAEWIGRQIVAHAAAADYSYAAA